MPQTIRVGETIDASKFDYIEIIGTANAFNAGTVSGRVAAHLIIQEKRVFSGFGIGQEVALVELHVKPFDGKGAVVSRDLSARRDDQNPRAKIAWSAPIVTLGRGETRSVTFLAQIGVDLLVNKTDLDLVLILDRLDTETGVPLVSLQGPGFFERRLANQFGVISGGGNTFAPEGSSADIDVVGV